MDRVALIENLDFRYRAEQPLALVGVHLELFRGQRCLVVGANGAGKSTLLKVLAGRHMVAEDRVRILDRPAFHDTSLVRDVSYVGGRFEFNVDMAVGEILTRRPAVDPRRRQQLIDILEVQDDWHMHWVSDGQRRRVHLLLSLEQHRQVLLLDEVTTDLDVVVRANLLSFLRAECEEQGTAILYATHIFDGLEDWATDIALLERGEVVLAEPLAELDALVELHQSGMSSPLYRLVERWIRFGFAYPTRT